MFNGGVSEVGVAEEDVRWRAIEAETVEVRGGRVVEGG